MAQAWRRIFDEGRGDVRDRSFTLVQRREAFRQRRLNEAKVLQDVFVVAGGCIGADPEHARRAARIEHEQVEAAVLRADSLDRLLTPGRIARVAVHELDMVTTLCEAAREIGNA